MEEADGQYKYLRKVGKKWAARTAIEGAVVFSGGVDIQKDVAKVTDRSDMSLR